MAEANPPSVRIDVSGTRFHLGEKAQPVLFTINLIHFKWWLLQTSLTTNIFYLWLVRKISEELNMSVVEVESEEWWVQLHVWQLHLHDWRLMHFQWMVIWSYIGTLYYLHICKHTKGIQSVYIVVFLYCYTVIYTGLIQQYLLKNLFTLNLIRSVCTCMLCGFVIYVAGSELCYIYCMYCTCISSTIMLADDQSFLWYGRNIKKRCISEEHQKVQITTMPLSSDISLLSSPLPPSPPSSPPLPLSLNRMKEMHAVEYDILPQTWVLPHEYRAFIKDTRKRRNSKTYIIKPPNSSMGNG